MTNFIIFENLAHVPSLPFHRNGKIVTGWHRTNTSTSGNRYVGFGTFHSEICLSYEDGSSEYGTLVHRAK